VAVAPLVIRVYRSLVSSIHRFFTSLGRVRVSCGHICVYLAHSLRRFCPSIYRSVSRVRVSSDNSCVSHARSCTQSILPVDRSLGQSVVFVARLVIHVYRSLASSIHRCHPLFGGVSGSCGHSCVYIACELHRSRVLVSRVRGPSGHSCVSFTR
jgi:hypothetical protein